MDKQPLHTRTRLRDVNIHLTCGLCNGYFIDATTIVECLHTFCRSCIVTHLKLKSYCPICEVMINTAKPNIKPDKTLQDIVYKLVPGLHRNEMRRRRRFYASIKSGSDPRLFGPSIDSEQRGVDNERVVYDSTDKMSLSLEYFDGTELSHNNNLPLRKNVYDDASNEDGTVKIKPPIRYLECVAGMAVRLLKKFVVAKFDIDTTMFHVDILYKGIPLADHYTIMDIAYIYSWKRNEPMRFFFQVIDLKTHDERLYTPHESPTSYLIRKSFCGPKITKSRLKRLAYDGGQRIEQQQHLKRPNETRLEPVSFEIDPKTIKREPDAVETDTELATARVKSEPDRFETADFGETVERIIKKEPDLARTDLECIPRRPESISGDPESVSRDPESVSRDPESISRDPESIPRDPENIRSCDSEQSVNVKKDSSVRCVEQEKTDSRDVKCAVDERVIKDIEGLRDSVEGVKSGLVEVKRDPEKVTMNSEQVTIGVEVEVTERDLEDKRREPEGERSDLESKKTLEADADSLDGVNGNVQRIKPDPEGDKNYSEGARGESERVESNRDQMKRDSETVQSEPERVNGDVEREKGDLERQKGDFERQKGDLERPKGDLEREKGDHEPDRNDETVEETVKSNAAVEPGSSQKQVESRTTTCDPATQQNEPGENRETLGSLETDRKPSVKDPDNGTSPSRPAEPKPDRTTDDDEKSMFLNGFELTSTKSVSPKKLDPPGSASSAAPPILKLILERIPSTSSGGRKPVDQQRVSPKDPKQQRTSPKDPKPRPTKRKLGRPPGRPPSKKPRVGDNVAQQPKLDKFVVPSQKTPKTCPVSKMVRNVSTQSDQLTKLVSRSPLHALKRKHDDPEKKTPGKNGLKVDPPNDSQTKALKSLFDSCNLNIPSSLSITLTDPEKEDDGAVASHNSVAPKQQNVPLNMYIEIFKIPDKSEPQVAKIMPGQSILKKSPKQIAPKTSDGFVVPYNRIVQQQPVLQRPGTPRILPACNGLAKASNLLKPNVKVAIPNSNFIVTTTGIQSLGHKPGPAKLEPPPAPMKLDPTTQKHDNGVQIIQNELISKPAKIRETSPKNGLARCSDKQQKGLVSNNKPIQKPSGSKLAESGFQKMFEEAIKKKEEARAQEWVSSKQRNQLKNSLLSKSSIDGEPKKLDESVEKDAEIKEAVEKRVSSSNPGSALDLSSPGTKSDQSKRPTSPVPHQRRPIQNSVEPVPSSFENVQRLGKNSKLKPDEASKGLQHGRSVLKNGKSQYQSDTITSSALNVDTTPRGAAPAQLSPDTIQQQFNLTNLAQLNASVEHILMLRQHMEIQNRFGAHNPWMLNATNFVHFENMVKSMQQQQQQRAAQHGKK